MALEVLEATIDGNTLTVRFSDSYLMSFVLCANSRQRATSLREARITGNGHVLVAFNSSRQRPITKTPFGFTEMAPGWTPAAFARYWRRAERHLRGRFTQDRESEAFRFMVVGGQDLIEIEAGNWNRP